MDNKIENELEKFNKPNKCKNLIREVITYVLIILFVILIRTFIVTPVRVDGDSMNNNLKNGEILLLKKYDKSYERFDVVVFKYGNDKLIKRVIGLPGESVKYKDSKLYINDKYVEENMIKKITYDFDLRELGFDEIPIGYYFVMGDNRNASCDSRHPNVGLIKRSQIYGKAVLKYASKSENSSVEKADFKILWN